MLDVGSEIRRVDKKLKKIDKDIGKNVIELFTTNPPSRATLVSIFPGGARRERRVSGVIQRKYLNNIRPEYSRVYRIKDEITVTADKKHKESTSVWRPSSSSSSSSWMAFTPPPRAQRDQTRVEVKEGGQSGSELSSAVTAQSGAIKPDLSRFAVSVSVLVLARWFMD